MTNKYQAYAVVSYRIEFEDDGENSLDDQAFEVAKDMIEAHIPEIMDIELSDVEECQS